MADSKAKKSYQRCAMDWTPVSRLLICLQGNDNTLSQKVTNKFPNKQKSANRTAEPCTFPHWSSGFLNILTGSLPHIRAHGLHKFCSLLGNTGEVVDLITVNDCLHGLVMDSET